MARLSWLEKLHDKVSKTLKEKTMPRINFESDNLDTVKILKDDQLRVVFGAPSDAPVYIVGEPGPPGPTGAAGGVQYFYGLSAPGSQAVTGDRWFHPGVGLEFTKIQGQWVQIYRNQKR
jgi:hypothetical protein